ncbi:MAG: hypothetical protein O3A19_04925 [Planctomycetota bacterium]|nr:hypothetical protein [Planctomycetota bacterium]
MHEPESPGRDVGLPFLEDPTNLFASLGGEIVALQCFQAVESVLVEYDDQRDPDQCSNQDRLARHLECGVLEDEPVHQHDQADGGLEQEAHAGYSSGLLIGEMVGSHEPRSDEIAKRA